VPALRLEKARTEGGLKRLISAKNEDLDFPAVRIVFHRQTARHDATPTTLRARPRRQLAAANPQPLPTRAKRHPWTPLIAGPRPDPARNNAYLTDGRPKNEWTLPML